MAMLLLPPPLLTGKPKAAKANKTSDVRRGSRVRHKRPKAITKHKGPNNKPDVHRGLHAWHKAPSNKTPPFSRTIAKCRGRWAKCRCRPRIGRTTAKGRGRPRIGSTAVKGRGRPRIGRIAVKGWGRPRIASTATSLRWRWGKDRAWARSTCSRADACRQDQAQSGSRAGLALVPSGTGSFNTQQGGRMPR